MKETKISPSILRLLVIFPNMLSYALLIGVIVYILTNFNALRAADALNFWLILAVILAPVTISTTYTIVKKMKAGTL